MLPVDQILIYDVNNVAPEIIVSRIPPCPNDQTRVITRTPNATPAPEENMLYPTHIGKRPKPNYYVEESLNCRNES